MLRKAFALAAALCLAAGALNVPACAEAGISADISEAAAGEAESIIGGILDFELASSGSEDIPGWISGSLTENAGKSSEWYAMILARSTDSDLSGYAAALEGYIRGNEIRSASTRMKNALALLAAGGSRELCSDIAESSVGEQGIMSLIYGLHLLNNGCECSRYTAETLTAELLETQFPDGGWAIMGNNGDIDVTAMTVQALAPYYETSAAVTAALDRAVGFLSDKQQEDGGYQSFGTPNPESASQVLIAVSALGIDIDDPRFMKNGHTLIDGIAKYRLPDGSFTHTEGGDSNITATTQAWLSLTAYRLMRDKGERFYDFPETAESAGNSGTAGAQTAAETEPPVTSAAADFTVSSFDTTAAPLPSATPEPTEDKQPSGGSGYKPIAYAVTAGVGAAACAVLFILKKRRMSNFIAVLIAVGVGETFIFFTDFRSSEEYYSSAVTAKENVVGTVTMTIRCDTIVGKSDSQYIPADGVILPVTEFRLAENETAYDILAEAARSYNIQMQSSGGYVVGIGYLYEYDFGDLSGWIYRINGDAPFVMCSEYELSDGDVIEWLYTCELGNDLL